MQLVEQRKINLDDNISAYLPEFTEGDRITVRQLLNHTSGFCEYRKISNCSISNTYGTYNYANVNYGLLGKIIESVSRTSYEKYLTENIFIPLNMIYSAATLENSKNNGLINGYRNFFGYAVIGKLAYPDDNSWSQVCTGYINSSASDMGKYLQMYLNGGKNVLKKESIHSMFYDNVDIPNSNVKYGMGWALTEDYSEPILSHDGLVENYMSHMFILPESEIGCVILVNENDYLVTNTTMNSVSDSIILMLKGNDPIIISNTVYWGSHLLYDGIYLVLLIFSIDTFCL
jgi:CubicO group peptidase (beta-lactamase class C family)